MTDEEAAYARLVSLVLNEVVVILERLQAEGRLRGVKITLPSPPPHQDPDAALPQPAHGKPKDGEGGAGAAASIGGGEAPASLTSAPV